MLRDTDKSNLEMVAAMVKVRLVLAWRNKVAENLNAGATIDPKTDVLPPVTDWQLPLTPGQADPFAANMRGCVAKNPKSARDTADHDLIAAEWEQDDAKRAAKIEHATAMRKFVARQSWGIPGYGSY